MRRDAEFLVERPVLVLVFREVLVGFKATGALERGGLGAGRITTGWSGFCGRRRFGRVLASFHFWGRLLSVEGVEREQIG